MATTPEREKSYINWRGKVLPVDLARAGFVYTGEDDKVFCTSCNIKLASWEANDKPFEEHKSNSGTCPFVCGVLKVCQESNRECDDVLCCDEVECCAQSSRCTQADAIPRNIPFGDDLVGVQSMDDMDLNHEGQRRATFKGWPLENPSVDKLLDAGFCYTGKRDIVMCYVCKGYVFKWRPDDDPLEEHKTLYRNKCTLMQGFMAQQEADMQGLADVVNCK